MPNWMECEVQIIGPTDEIARFRTAHIGNDQNGELQLDFDSIIPMPPELRDTNATPSDAFVWALGGELYASRNLSRRLGYEMADATPLDLAWVRELEIISREGLLNWAEVNRPDKLVVAKRVMEVERATGYRTGTIGSATTGDASGAATDLCGCRMIRLHFLCQPPGWRLSQYSRSWLSCSQR